MKFLSEESSYVDAARGIAVADAFEVRECDDGGCVGNLAGVRRSPSCPGRRR